MKRTSLKRAYTAPITKVFFVEAEGVLAQSPAKVSFSGTGGGATFGSKGWSEDDLDTPPPAPSMSGTALTGKGYAGGGGGITAQ